MPIRPNSSLRKKRKHYHGWKDGDAYFLSIYPRKDNEPANQYVAAQDALREATTRHLPIVWEDPSVI